ncbi:MAG: DCC1-like thiol-disulfide oxidoreductase family protein [Terracidiphilus sp.]
MDGIGDRLLVVFDGHCGLCNGWVRWLLCHDTQDRLRFAAFDSPSAADLLARQGIASTEAESVPATILVVRNVGGPAEQVLVRSDAVLALLAELRPPWPAVAAAFRWIPQPLRDQGYRLVARWRYRIRERLESCPIPTNDERERFL